MPLSGWGGLPFGTLDTTGIDKIDLFRVTSLQKYFASKAALSAVESTILFGETGLVSATHTLVQAKNGALTGNDCFAKNLTPQFLTGNWSGGAFDIGAENPFRDGDGGDKSLLIFGGNTCTDNSPIKFTLDAGEKFDASAWNVIISNVGTDVYSLIAAPGGDSHLKLTLTPTINCVIEDGSYLYFEWTGDALVAVKGVIKISGASLAIATGT